MTEKCDPTGARRPYRKPQLEQVQLVAEEAVLMGCKNSTGTAQNKTPCNAPGCKASWGT